MDADMMDVSSDPEQAPIDPSTNTRVYDKANYSRKKSKPKNTFSSESQQQEIQQKEYSRKIRSRYIRSSTEKNSSSTSSGRGAQNIAYDDFDEPTSTQKNSSSKDENRIGNQISIASVMKKLRSKENKSNIDSKNDRIPKTERKSRSKSDGGEMLTRPFSARRSKSRSNSNASLDGSKQKLKFSSPEKDERLSRSLFNSERKRNHIERRYSSYEGVENSGDANANLATFKHRSGSMYDRETILPEVHHYSSKRYLEPKPPLQNGSDRDAILQDTKRTQLQSYMSMHASENSQKFLTRNSDDIYEVKRNQTQNRRSTVSNLSRTSSRYSMSSSSSSSASSLNAKGQRKFSSGRVTIPKPFNLSYHQVGKYSSQG
uniref:Uncharacterized protein n=1 Tax=Aplanochytrium stocchinoi TaxID=215587 RepID=A0A7S3PQ05_9STRA